MTAPKPREPSVRAALFVLAAIWLALFAPQLFASKAFLLGDTAHLRAFAEYSSGRWTETHERTHWNPYLFFGLPTTASLADTRPQFLPDALLSAYDAVHRLPGFPPLGFALVAHVAGMLACAMLARRLWDASPVGMVVAGLAWGLMPNLIVPFTFGHDPQQMATSLLPVAMLLVHETVAASPAALPLTALLLAFALALTLLAQYPQIVLYLAPLAIAFGIERALRFRRLGRLVWLAGAAGFGAAISAASWWPALLYNQHSVRAGSTGGVGWEEVSRYSLALRDLLSSVWPWAVGRGGGSYWGGMPTTDFPQFLGATVIALAVLGLARGDRSTRGSATLLAITGSCGALVALGTNLGPLYRLLYDHVPLWSSFRLAVNGMIVSQLAAALLAARGADTIGAWRPSRALWPLLAGVVVALLLLFTPARDFYVGAATAARPRMGPRIAADIASIAALDLVFRSALAAGVLAWTAFAATRRARLPVVIAGFVALIGLDLGTEAVPFLRKATGSLGPIEHPRPPAVAVLTAKDPSHRALGLTRELFFANDWIRWRARSVSGNHPAAPLRWADLRNRGALGQHEVLRAFSVRYAAGEVRGVEDTTRFEAVTGLPAIERVWRVRQALPRARTVARVIAVANQDSVIAGLLAPEFDAARIALVSDPVAAGDYPGSPTASLRWLDDSPDHQALEVTSSDRAFVVVADALLAGWSATLDGRPITIHAVNHMMRGIAVPPGVHRIAMAYEPEGWRGSVAVTRMAGAAWVVMIGGTWVFWRRSRATA